MNSTAQEEAAVLGTQVLWEDDLFILTVSGEIDLEAVPVLKEIFKEVSGRATGIIVDMSGVTYVDSSGFGVLLDTARRLRPTEVKLCLAGCNTHIQHMLEITRLASVFMLSESVADARVALIEDGM